MSSTADESREGVALTNLDASLFDGAQATKRDLVDYLDRISARILPQLAGRPLSVIRVHRGQEAFMQKNVPRYARCRRVVTVTSAGLPGSQARSTSTTSRIRSRAWTMFASARFQ